MSRSGGKRKAPSGGAAKRSRADARGVKDEPRRAADPGASLTPQGGKKPAREGGPTQRLELVEERLEVGKRSVERGRVTVRTRVDEREELAEATLRHVDVMVERVPVGRPVEAAPPVREEDGVTIIPVLEEQVVVQTRLILKEEIRITRTARTEAFREPVRLRSEHAEIVRQEGPGGGEGDTEEGGTA